MQQFRESIFCKALCVFLSLVIFNLGCSPVGETTTCSTLTLDLSTTADLPDRFEAMLDLSYSLHWQNDYQTYGDFYTELFGSSETALANIQAFETESDRYQQMGFENYMMDLVRRGKISEQFSQELITFKGQLTTFLQTENPELDQLTNFLDTRRQQITESALCSKDKNLMERYLDLAQGYAQFYYKMYLQEEAVVQLRGCGFFQAIGCGIFAAIVGVVTFSVTNLILTISNIHVNGQPTTESDQEIIAVLAGLALGIYVGINLYQWCCGKDEVKKQNCQEPTGSYYRQIDCNRFKYAVFGASRYSNTIWNNLNTEPSQATTPIPVLRFSVPEIGQQSAIVAMIACVEDGNTVEIYTHEKEETFQTQGGPLQIEWMVTPPEKATLNLDFATTFPISVKVPANSQHLVYDWQVNAPNRIQDNPNSSNTEVEFTQRGRAFTRVTVTNDCTGESQTLSFTTIVE